MYILLTIMICNRGDVQVAAQQTQNICITFIQCRPNVFHGGLTLYKCYSDVLCLLSGAAPIIIVGNDGDSGGFVSSTATDTFLDAPGFSHYLQWGTK